MRKVLEFLGLLPVYCYRLFIRPFKPRSCAFLPTCSEYALIAIRRHGIVVGWAYALRRLGKCRPFSKKSGGYEPVPWKLNGGSKWVV